MLLIVGSAQLWSGRVAEAATSADAMLDACRALDLAAYRQWGWSLAAWVAMYRDDPDVAVAAAHRADASAHPSLRGPFDTLNPCVLGAALLAAGKPERARAEILRHGGGPQLARLARGSHARWYGLLAETELALGRLQEARHWLQEAEETARGELTLPRAAVLRTRALILLDRAGEPEAAERFADAAARIFRAHGNVLEAARVDVVSGRAAAAAGNPERAIDRLTAAYQRLETAGATSASAEAATELRRLGGVIASGVRDHVGVGRLTAREREVAELIGAGLTNKQVGAELCLSERTVENHATHIFRKLGIVSRSELPRVLAFASRR
jgi:DNA-binding NarL/FixJ family response regulator